MHSCISLICLVTLLSTLLGRFLQRQKRVFVSNISDIIALLNPPEASISDLLLARAEPNTRLVHAFGLENTFVSADSMLRERFIARAREILRQHTRQFAAFPDVVRGVVEESAHRLHSLSPEPSISFAIFVEVVTLRIVVGSLLGGNIPEDSDEDTVFVVEAIKELWTLSKKVSRPPPATAALLDALNTHLHSWMPEKYERPLDFVIPAYETMWRVIAATVARANHDTGACAAFCAYLDSPTQDQFVRFDNSRPQKPSVEAFLCEVLRLHPPSRGIARTAPSRSTVFGYPLWATAATHVADIQALHQDTATWGSDAALFDPMRFHESRLSYRQKHAFMPFSHGPLRCVAFKEAPRFAAIAAAAILEVISGRDARYRLVCGERIGRRDGWDGWLIEVCE